MFYALSSVTNFIDMLMKIDIEKIFTIFLICESESSAINSEMCVRHLLFRHQQPVEQHDITYINTVQQ